MRPAAGDFEEDEDTAVTAAPVELPAKCRASRRLGRPHDEAAQAELAALAAASTEAAGDVDPEAEVPVAVPGRLESVLESLLFASDRPLSVNDLKKPGRRAGRREGDRRAGGVARPSRAGRQRHHRRRGRGWLAPADPHGQPGWVSRLVAGKPQRLTRAMLETLSIVAYRQPITRPEIDDMRGVDCGPVLKTLLDRGLVRMIGKKEEVGRPILYGTTPEFLRIFSLKRSGRAADAARVPRAERGRHGEGRRAGAAGRRRRREGSGRGGRSRRPCPARAGSRRGRRAADRARTGGRGGGQGGGRDRGDDVAGVAQPGSRQRRRRSRRRNSAACAYKNSSPRPGCRRGARPRS